MYNHILRQIANTIYINYQHIEQPGLLNGNMGIVLFLYHYSRFTNSNQYEVVAEELIDSVYERMNKKTVPSFADGLGGIGWGFEYLKKHGFLTMEEDVLEEIDAVVYNRTMEEMVKEMDDDIPLYTEGIYYLMRSSGLKDRNKIYTNLYELMKRMQDKILPVTYLNSILYTISGLQKQQVHSAKEVDLLRLVMVHVNKSIEAKGYSDADLYILKVFLRKISGVITHEKEVASLLSVMEKENKDVFNEDVYFNWQNMLYFGGMGKTPVISDIYRISESVFNRIADINAKNLSLSGLAGIGVNLIL